MLKEYVTARISQEQKDQLCAKNKTRFKRKTAIRRRLAKMHAIQAANDQISNYKSVQRIW
jgi:hypothetical protein